MGEVPLARTGKAKLNNEIKIKQLDYILFEYIKSRLNLAR